MALKYLSLLLLLRSFAAEVPVNADDVPPSPRSSHIDIFVNKDKSLFALKRREQIETVEKIWDADDYTKQYKTVAFVVDNIFPILEDSLRVIREIEYVPGLSSFPEEQSIQEVLGKVYENVIFFGDFVLRMPDISKKVLRTNKKWRPIMEEAVLFCNRSTDIFSGPHARQLHLMSQEMGLIPKDEDYVNPFKAHQATKPNERMKKMQAKKDGKKKKGPKLRGSRQFKTEL